MTKLSKILLFSAQNSFSNILISIHIANCFAIVKCFRCNYLKYIINLRGNINKFAHNYRRPKPNGSLFSLRFWILGIDREFIFLGLRTPGLGESQNDQNLCLLSETAISHHTISKVIWYNVRYIQLLLIPYTF